MNSWSLIYEGFDPDQERLREALCTLGNGYFATRGASAEAQADDTHYPGTYLAGGYNRLQTEIAGRIIENEDLVNMPNWLPLTFRFDGGSWFSLKAVEILAYRQELDLKRGVLHRTVRFRDHQNRETTMSSRRIVHIRDRQLAAIETTLTAENWSGGIDIRSGLDGRVHNAGVARYRDLNGRHLEPLETKRLTNDIIRLKVQTNQSELRIAEAARSRLFRHGQPLSVEWRLSEEPGYIAQETTVDVVEGTTLTVEKIVALATSRDHAISECGLEAMKLIDRTPGYAELLETHQEAWRQLWNSFDIDIDLAGAENLAPLILHLHIFHLLQTVSPHTIDLDVGVPPRGLHGEAYRGHILWDELFIYPFLNLRMPEITRALLMYRHRRLNEARASAREAGCRGAMYPWQSGSDGREESQHVHLNPRSGRWVPDNSPLQRHVNAAIAYNVWHYFQVTGDMEFLCFYGADMLFEIARFWSSLATYNASLARYEILKVMGPDEYHDGYPGAKEPGLNNNAYTNIMAVWVLGAALEALAILPEDRRGEICDRLDLGQAELERWEAISRKMRVVFHDEDIISQFEGYDQLQEFDWEGYRRAYGNIQRLDRILEAEGNTPNRYKMSKQADVLMLFYLFSAEELSRLFTQLGYPFTYDTIPRNTDYYMQRTAHGSTLSRVVHSWVLARRDRPRSWQLFIQALESDTSDIQGGTTPEGIHLGAMAGTIDLVQRAYTGIETRGHRLLINPRLPEGLKHMHLRIRYRGHTLDFDINPDTIRVDTRPCTAEPMTLGFQGRIYELRGGERRELAF